MYSVESLENGERAFRKSALLFSAVVDRAISLNSLLRGKNIRILSGFRPDDLNGDHKQGLAIDINADDVPSLFWFWATIVHNWSIFQQMGVTKCFLLLHAKGVHLSFAPAEGSIRGYEDYNGGDRRDARSYPIPRFTHDLKNTEQIILLNKASTRYSVSMQDIEKYFTTCVGESSGGCLPLVSFFFFLFGYAEVINYFMG